MALGPCLFWICRLSKIKKEIVHSLWLLARSRPRKSQSVSSDLPPRDYLVIKQNHIIIYIDSKELGYITAILVSAIVIHSREWTKTEWPQAKQFKFTLSFLLVLLTQSSHVTVSKYNLPNIEEMHPVHAVNRVFSFTRLDFLARFCGHFRKSTETDLGKVIKRYYFNKK